jgi:radical SAM-linked protein
VQRLRLRYAKRGRLRFTSHRDVARAFERAVRRAGLPVAFSAGFSPHPRISWVGAAPTGVASEAEYVEIGLSAAVSPPAAAAALDAALPAGLDILDCVPSAGGGLPDLIEASRWRVTLPAVDPGALATALAAFLAAETVEVERRTKDGRRRVDARGAVLTATLAAGLPSGGANCATLDLVVRHTTPAVRPDDVLTALSVVGDLPASPEPPLALRLAQGRLLSDGTLGDPLAPDRVTAAAGPPVGS